MQNYEIVIDSDFGVREGRISVKQHIHKAIMECGFGFHPYAQQGKRGRGRGGSRGSQNRHLGTHIQHNIEAYYSNEMTADPWKRAEVDNPTPLTESKDTHCTLSKISIEPNSERTNCGSSNK